MRECYNQRMLPEYFAFIGAIISTIGGLYYFLETIRGKTKPNRVTYGMWTLFPLVIFIAQRAEGVEEISYTSLVYAMPSFLTFVATFIVAKSYWKTRALDFWCLGSALVGIVLWAITDNALLALAFTLLADFASSVPTLYKSYIAPETESSLAYATVAFGSVVTLLAVQVWNFESVALVMLIAVVSTAMAVLASRKPAATIVV